MTFESLYEKGRVYVFPRLVPREEGTASSSDDDTEDESHPLLGHPEVEDAEFRVKDLLRFTLQNSMSANQEDLPSFVLHNTRLSKQENVTLIVDRKIGVVVMVTKLNKSSRSLSLQAAVTNLLQARDAVMVRLQGLVQLCDVTAILSLPYLTPQQADDVKILSSYPDVELLPGLDLAHYRQWMGGLRREKASKVWRSSSQGGDHPDTVYKMAASSFLTLAGCGSPGESPHSPDPAQSWLLTPAQVEVRDSTARLLHVWGPPGSGKTTLLVHRARQWLAEGKVMVLGVGREFDDVKLAQIYKAVKEGQTEEALSRLRVIRTYQEVRRAVRELKGTFSTVDICIVIDTLRDERAMFKKMLSAVREKEPLLVMSNWRKNFADVDSELAKEAFQLGWESLKLPACIRSTKDTVELMNLLGKDVYPPIPSCSLPRDPDIPAWRVVDHSLHPDHVNTVSRCDGCKTEMSQILPSPEQDLPRSNWIALHSGNVYVSRKYNHLKEALLHLGVPASYEGDAYLRNENAPPSPASAPDAPAFDFASFRERVIDGVDKEGRPTVHLIRLDDFRGMERKGVILVHWDERDNDPQQQREGDRNTRLEEHRVQWFNAASRSKGQVILLLLTPSPARSLLGLPEPVMAQ